MVMLGAGLVALRVTESSLWANAKERVVTSTATNNFENFM
jgi:hypothetical protein